MTGLPGYDEWATRGPDETHEECISDEELEDAKKEAKDDGKTELATALADIIHEAELAGEDASQILTKLKAQINKYT